MPLLQTALPRPPPAAPRHLTGPGVSSGAAWTRGAGLPPAAASPGPQICLRRPGPGCHPPRTASSSIGWRPGAGGLGGGGFWGPWQGRVWPRAEQRTGRGEDRGRLVPAPPLGPSPLPAWRRRKTPGEQTTAWPHLQAGPSRCWARPCPHPLLGFPEQSHRTRHARGFWIELPPSGDLARGADVSVHALGRGGERGGPQCPGHKAAEGPSTFAASLPSQRVTRAPSFQTGHCRTPASVTAQNPGDRTPQPDRPGASEATARGHPGNAATRDRGPGSPETRATGGGLRALDGRGQPTACPVPAPHAPQ